MKFTDKDLAFYLFCLCVIASYFWPNEAKGQSGTIEMPKTVFGSCFSNINSISLDIQTSAYIPGSLSDPSIGKVTKDTVTVRIACPEFINVLTWEPQKNNPEKWIEILEIKHSRMERTFEMRQEQVYRKPSPELAGFFDSEFILTWETKLVQIDFRYLDPVDGCY